MGQFRTLVCVLAASGLGLFCSVETLEQALPGVSEWFQQGRFQEKMVHLELTMKELHRKDAVILNRLTVKKDVVLALHRKEITPKEAASCFLHLIQQGKDGMEVVLPAHKGLNSDVRAGYCLLFWLIDEDCPGLRERNDVREFAQRLEDSKRDEKPLGLPLPPVHILANHLY